MFFKSQKRKGAWDPVSISIGIAVVALLIAIALPKYQGFVEDGKRSAVEQEVRLLATQCALYAAKAKSSQPPDHLGELVNGLTQEQSNNNRAHGSFLANLSMNKFTNDPASFVDKWGNPYQYDKTARTVSSTMNGDDPFTVDF